MITDPQQPQPPIDVRPPTGPKVLGVLSIIFASITLLFSLMNGWMSMAGQQGNSTWMVKGLPNAEARNTAYKRFYEATHPATVAQTMIYTLMSAALLIIGIGQLKYRGWARSLSVYWGILALLSLAASVLISLLVVRPANQALFQELSQAAGSGSVDSAVNSMLGSFASSPLMILGSLIFYAPYPIILVLYFSRARMRAAMEA